MARITSNYIKAKRLKNESINKIKENLKTSPKEEAAIEDVANLLMNQKIQSTNFSNKSLAFNFTKKKTAVKTIEENKYLTALYKNKFFKNVMDAFINPNTINNSNKKQDGQTLLKNTIRADRTFKVALNKNPLNKSIINSNDLYLGVEHAKNIVSKKGKIVSYDLETLGGMNEFGHHEISDITEAFARVHDLKTDNVKNVGSFFGISNKQYKKELEMLNDIKEKPYKDLSEKEKIFLNRYALYGHENTEISQVKASAIFNVTKAASPDDMKEVFNNKHKTIEFAEKGIEKRRSIGKKQENALIHSNINLEDFKNRVLDNFHNKTLKGDKDTLILSQNGFNFDTQMLNRFLHQNKQIDYSTNLDMFQVVSKLMETNKTKELFKNYNPNINSTNKFGFATLEQMAEMILGKPKEGEAAHTALYDSERAEKVLLSLNDLYEPFYMKLNDEIKKRKNEYSTFNPVTDSKTPYLSNFTVGSNDANISSLSFSYNKNNNIIRTFNGKTFNGDKLDNEYSQWGPKTHALYTHDLIEADIDNKELDKIVRHALGLSDNDKISHNDYQKLFGKDFDQRKMFILKSTPYVDKNKMKEITGSNIDFSENIYTISSDYNALTQIIGEKFDNNIKQDIYELVKNEKGELVRKQITDPKAKLKAIETMSFNKHVNDTISRDFRGMNYNKANNFLKFKKEVDKYKDFDEYAKHLNELMLKGVPLTNELQNSLGFLDTINNSLKLYPSTIKKSVEGYSYLNSLGDVVEELVSMTNSKYKIDKTMSEAEQSRIKIERNKAFENAKNVYFNYIEDKTNINDSSKTYLFENEAKVIDLDLNKINKKYAESLKINNDLSSKENVLTLNLNKRNSIVNTFYKAINNGSDDKKGIYGANALLVAFDEIEKQIPDFKFESVSRDDIYEAIKNGSNIEYLNELMQRELKGVNHFLFERKTDIRIGESLIKDVDSKIKSEAMNEARKALGMTPTMANTETFEKSLLEKVIMPFSKKDYSNELTALGFNDKEKNISLKLYDNLKVAMDSFALNVKNAAYESNGSITIGDNKDVVYSLGDRISKLNIPKVSMKNGELSLNINDSYYIPYSKLKIDPNDIRNANVVSSLQDGISTISLQKSIHRRVENGQDPFEAMTTSINKLVNSFADKEVRVDNFGAQSHLFSRSVNMNEMLGYIDKYNESGVFENSNLTEEMSNTLKSISKKAKEKREKNGKLLTADDLMGNEFNYFTKFFKDPISEYIKADDMLYKNINMSNKDVKTIQLLDTIGFSYPQPEVVFNHQASSSLMFNSTYSLFYNEQTLKEDMQKLNIDSNFSLRTVFTNPVTDKNNKILTASNNYVSSINMKYSHIDSHELNRRLNQNLPNDKNDYKDTSLYNIIKNKFNKELSFDEYSKYRDRILSNSNTHEQQALMSPKMKWIGFNNQYSKIIGENKKISIDGIESNYEKELIKDRILNSGMIISDGKVEYKPGSSVSKNSLLLAVEKSNSENADKIYSNENGVLVSNFKERKSNVTLKDDKIALEYKRITGKDISKNTTSADIIDALSDEYKYVYELIPREEQSAIKVAIGASEKATLQNIEVGLGSIDNNLRNKLSKLGVPDSEFDVVHSRAYFENYLVKKYNIPEDLVQDILNERFALGNVMNSIINKDENSDFGIIGAVNIKKHSNLSVALSDYINTVVEDTSLSESEKQEKIREVVRNGEFVDNKLAIDPRVSYEVDVESIEKYMHEKAKKTGVFQNSLAIHHINDYSEGAYSSITTQRDLLEELMGYSLEIYNLKDIKKEEKKQINKTFNKVEKYIKNSEASEFLLNEKDKFNDEIYLSKKIKREAQEKYEELLEKFDINSFDELQKEKKNIKKVLMSNNIFESIEFQKLCGEKLLENSGIELQDLEYRINTIKKEINSKIMNPNNSNEVNALKKELKSLETKKVAILTTVPFNAKSLNDIIDFNSITKKLSNFEEMTDSEKKRLFDIYPTSKNMVFKNNRIHSAYKKTTEELNNLDNVYYHLGFLFNKDTDVALESARILNDLGHPEALDVFSLVNNSRKGNLDESYNKIKDIEDAMKIIYSKNPDKEKKKASKGALEYFEKANSYVEEVSKDLSLRIRNNELEDNEKEILKKSMSEEYDNYFSFVNNIDKKMKDIYKNQEKIKLKQAALNEKKGVKIDENVVRNLRLQTYSDDNSTRIYKHLVDNLGIVEGSKEFKNIFTNKYIDNIEEGRVFLKDDIKGKSILEPIINDIQNRLLYNPDELNINDLERFGDVIPEKKRGKYNDIAKYVSKYYKDDPKFKDISLDRAEKRFSLMSNIYAQKANEMSLDEKENFIEELTALPKNSAYAFKNMDIGDMETDFRINADTILNHPNNPYSNNIILNTGLDGDLEKIAIGKSPTSYYNEKFIKEKYQEAINYMKLNYDEWQDAEKIGDVSASEKMKKRYIESINNFLSEQRKFVSGKDGMVSELQEFRMKGSFSGKAALLPINFGDEIVDGKTVARTIESFEKLPTNERYDILKELNPSFLDNSIIGEKSILEHYSEGKYYNYAFSNREAFEKMGLFERKNIIKTLSENDYLDVRKLKSMKTDELTAVANNYYSEYGINVMGTRFPRIQEGSDQIFKMFLDPTNSTSKNIIKVSSGIQYDMNMDFDGDPFHIVSMGKNKKEIDQYYLERAIGNRYPVGLSINKTEKDSEMVKTILSDSESFYKEIMNEKSNLIGNTMYSGVFNNDEMSLKDMRRISERDDVRTVVKNANDIVQNSEGELLTSDVLREQISHYADANNLSENEIVDLTKNISISKNYEQIDDEIKTAKMFKKSIGEANVTLYKAREIMAKKYDKHDPKYNYVMQLANQLDYLAEQQSISSKNDIFGLSVDRAKNLNTYVKGVLFNKDTGENSENLRMWMMENVKKDIDVEFFRNKVSNFDEIIGITKDKIIDGRLDEKYVDSVRTRVVNDFIDISKQVGGNDARDIFDSLSVGKSLTGVSSSRTATNLVFENTDNVSNKNILYKNLESIDELNVIEKDVRFGGNNKYRSKKSNYGFEQKFNIENKENISRKAFEKSAEIANGMKSSISKGIAVGALTIAASVMAVGYVGGRPRPAETQAMEESNQNVSSLELANPDIMNMQQSKQQGYVININAKSKAGRKEMEKVMQQLVQKNTTSNVNISMNVKEKHESMSDRYIDERVTGML